MPMFTITLAAERYETNTISVEAETVEEACRRALEADDGDYQPGDLNEPWIYAAALGEADGKPVDIPPEYRELPHPATERLARLLVEAVNGWPHLDTDQEVNGGDMVEWFDTWRDAAMRAIKAERPDLFAVEPWGGEDAECAAAEGWFLEESDFMSLIQALDDCDVFTGPTANLIAYQHVERRAKEGSWLHAKALRIHGAGAEGKSSEDVAA